MLGSSDTTHPSGSIPLENAAQDLFWMPAPAATFDRYERLTLQTTLDTMSDICWCPRCEFPAFLLDGEDGRLALCSTCQFSFCVECLLMEELFLFDLCLVLVFPIFHIFLKFQLYLLIIN